MSDSVPSFVWQYFICSRNENYHINLTRFSKYSHCRLLLLVLHRHRCVMFYSIHCQFSGANIPCLLKQCSLSFINVMFYNCEMHIFIPRYFYVQAYEYDHIECGSLNIMISCMLVSPGLFMFSCFSWLSGHWMFKHNIFFIFLDYNTMCVHYISNHV